MKNTKKIAFLCIAINIVLLLQLCFGTVMALDEDAVYVEPEQTVEETIIVEQAQEFQPIMPLGCTTPPSCNHPTSIQITASSQTCVCNSFAKICTSTCGNVIERGWNYCADHKPSF